jgi:hypothetical protein
VIYEAVISEAKMTAETDRFGRQVLA